MISTWWVRCEERSGHLTPRIDGITGMHGRTHQRTLDQALQELLTEWEQH